MTDADVVVIGAGIAGLTAAHDLARAGRSVIVHEASDRVGGLLRSATVGGVAVDVGAESFATRTDAVARLIADAGLDLELVSPRPGGAHLAVSAPEGIVRAPLPRRTVLGIPAEPTAPDVVRIIGADAATRAAAERELPPFDGAAEPSLRDLVAERCGPVVAERLVDTLCRSVYSRPASELRLSTLHPGMWHALGRHGSLVAAAEECASAVRAGASVGGIAGGMWRLPVALAGAAARHGAQLRTGVAVASIEGDAASRLVVRTTAGELTARRVVVATGPAAAARLEGEPTRADRSGRVRVVAAAIDHAGLDAFPVGSGVIVDPLIQTSAKALTHANAKWAWLDDAAPAGRHLVRLSARDADAAGLETAADIAREVTLLTGIPVSAADVVDVVVQEWPDAVAANTAADGDARPGATRARGIHRAGAAVAGTGLASVIPHARALAAQLADELAPAGRTARRISSRTTRSLA